MNGSGTAEPPDCLPLAMLRVLDLADNGLQGVGRMLADLGAEVLRVEPPGGSADRRRGIVDGGVSLTFMLHNANKRCITIDPGTTAGIERLSALLRQTDLVLLTPREAPWDVEVVRAARRTNPRLVLLELTDFGRTGPRRDWLATPAVHLALSTALSRSGLPEVREPLMPPEFLAFQAATAQALWVAVLSVFQAERTGVGDDVDFAVSEALIQTLDPGMGVGGSARAGATTRDLPRGRPDARHLYPIFPAADGWVRICLLSPRQWQGMFTWLGRPDEFADPAFNSLGARFAAARTLYPLIGSLLAPLTREQATAAGQALGVPVAGIMSTPEVLRADAFAAAGALHRVDLPDGRGVTAPHGWFEIDGRRAGFRHWPVSVGPDDTMDVVVPVAPPPAVAAPRTLPFAGLRVLDLGVIVVGAELGRLFGDYGADVIKIESTAFADGSRQASSGATITPGFAYGHRNKRSLGLNLRHEEGKRLFRELVVSSDVVLANFKPGTLEGLGFGWDELSAINPRIVLSESSAFGRTGPWSRRLGYGPLVRASSGLSAQWRYPHLDGSFSDAITIFPDHVVARLNAAAVTALLRRRVRTGRGGRVSTAQTDTILGAMADRLAAESLILGRGGRAAGGCGPQDRLLGVFASTGDDDWVVVEATGPEQLGRLADVVAGEPGSDLTARVSTWIATRGAREAAETFQARGVPAGDLVRVADLLTDPQLASRRFFLPFDQPQFDESMPAMSNEAQFGNLPEPRLGPAPLMAEHTEQIAAEVLGLGPAEIATLVENGALELHDRSVS